MSKGRYMRGFIAGGLVGMAAGMLMVDSKTRKKVISRGADMVQNASNMIPGMKK